MLMLEAAPDDTENRSTTIAYAYIRRLLKANGYERHGGPQGAELDVGKSPAGRGPPLILAISGCRNSQEKVDCGGILLGLG